MSINRLQHIIGGKKLQVAVDVFLTSITQPKVKLLDR